jgi:protein-disulfide isomerase
MEAAEESASEVFAPPGDVFQPPVASQPVSAPSSVDTAADSNETTPATKVDPSIVSTLLLLMPTRAATLDFLPVFIADESDESTASDQQTAESDEEPADSPRLISVAGNKFRLNSRHWPLIGNPDAKYIFVEMFDYTCPHCRRTHGSIAGACKRYGDDLAIIALPVPLDGKCNSTVSSTSSQHASSCEVSRLAVAVWRVKPSAFGEFHDWLFESTGNTRVSVARKKAEELVGTDALTAELANPYAGQYIEKHVDLYKRVGAGAVPKLLFPNATLTGAVSSTTTLCNTIDRELGSN